MQSITPSADLAFVNCCSAVGFIDTFFNGLVEYVRAFV